MLKEVFYQYLYSDLRAAALPALPSAVNNSSRMVLPGPCILQVRVAWSRVAEVGVLWRDVFVYVDVLMQVHEVVEVGPQALGDHGAPCRKFILSDGHMEVKSIE